MVCKAILCFTKMAAPNQNKLLLHTRSRVRDIDLHDLDLTIQASGFYTSQVVDEKCHKLRVHADS